MFHRIARTFDRLLPVGPRSVLWGAHCFFIHPFFVALAWTKLYGFPRDPRLWVAFFVHDLGYFFQWCPNMDGPEGERHVEWGAHLMGRLFDRPREIHRDHRLYRNELGLIQDEMIHRRREMHWYEFCLYHSRFYAKMHGRQPSRLCVADKLAVCLEPWWLYLPRVIATGEVREYLARAGGKDGGKYKRDGRTPEVQRLLDSGRMRDWFAGMTLSMRQWVEQHKDGRRDDWTPAPEPDPDRAATVEFATLTTSLAMIDAEGQ